jgi:hypothetical protein
VAGLVFCACNGPAREGGFGERSKRFQKHIAYLAGDELEGRGVGSKGIESAAEYIAAQYKEVGLSPAGSDGTYFQPFPIALQRTLVEGNRLKFSGEEQGRVQGKDFMPLAFSSSGKFSGKVVLCGYGITNSDKSHDDFKPVDLKGKTALVFDGEPAGWADAEGNPTRNALRRNKVYNVKDRNASAILFVNPRSKEGDKDALTPFVSEGADDYGLPAMHITREVAAAIFKVSGLGELDEVQKRLDGGATVSAEMVKVEIEGEVKFEKKTATTRNVLGVLKGSGPQAEEWVVIGAHYDHLGIRAPMMRTFKDGKIVEGTSVPEIHNGADDNASGVSGLIEIARSMAKEPKSNRSVLFIAFSAEETGLQGSKYYADHPFAPLDRTVAMLNMDMIGRLPVGGDRVTVFGANSAAEFMPILEAAGKVGGLEIQPGVDSGGRSDHAAFVRKGIPSLHFYSGNHSDYHKPSDDSPLINADGGARIATVVLETTKALADMKGRPALKEEKVAGKGGAAATDPHAGVKVDDPDKVPTYRVVMGLSPSYAEDGQTGMAVDAVSPEGPAEKAGMKAGDRIVKINGKPVANIYDYMASTRENKGGDTVDVVVLREGKEIVLKVTLSGAR